MKCEAVPDSKSTTSLGYFSPGLQLPFIFYVTLKALSILCFQQFGLVAVSQFSLLSNLLQTNVFLKTRRRSLSYKPLTGLRIRTGDSRQRLTMFASPKNQEADSN